jgi:hypothetical protein
MAFNPGLQALLGAKVGQMNNPFNILSNSLHNGANAGNAVMQLLYGPQAYQDNHNAAIANLLGQNIKNHYMPQLQQATINHLNTPQSTPLTQLLQMYHLYKTTNDSGLKQVLANDINKSTTHSSLFGNNNAHMTLTDPNTGHQIILNGSGSNSNANQMNGLPQLQQPQSPQQVTQQQTQQVQQQDNNTPEPPPLLRLLPMLKASAGGTNTTNANNGQAQSNNYPVTIAAPTPGDRYGRARTYQTGPNSGVVGDTPTQETADEKIVAGVQRSLPNLRKAAANLGQFQTLGKQLQEKAEGLSNHYFGTDYDLPSQKAEGKEAVLASVEGLVQAVTGKGLTDTQLDKFQKTVEPNHGESMEGYTRRVARLAISEMNISNQAKQRLLQGIPLDPSKPISFGSGSNQSGQSPSSNSAHLSAIRAELTKRGVKL